MIAVGIVLPGFSFATVAALDSADFTALTKTTNFAETKNTSTDDKTTTKPSDDTSTTTSTDDSAGRADRVAKRKSETKTKQTTAQQKRIQGVCKAAQGKATSTQARIKGLETSRGEVYKNLLRRLTEAQTKLQAKGLDTAELQTEITSLQTQVTTFQTDITAYKQAVGDLVALDCVADPTGFQVSLDAARAQRDKLQQESTAIKAYVTGTIKPTLKKLRDEVAKTETTTEPTQKEEDKQ